jgi:putative ATPase
MAGRRQPGLFDEVEQAAGRPLADRMRPTGLDSYLGQEHLLGEGRPLRRAIEQDRLHSMILWGPPGTGKTTLARLIARYCGANFLQISAVLGGVKEIREAVSEARDGRANGVATVLFVDEVHRFNKAQQDAFLPFVEDGTVTFIGATTENPSFELNNALLSRARTYLLKPLGEEVLVAILKQALSDERTGLGLSRLQVAASELQRIAAAADGDARRALTLLEIVADLAVGDGEGGESVSSAMVDEVIGGGGRRRFDKGGDAFYDQISALHKSVRGSAPDAALYWFARMIDGGADPLYVARRVVRMASEDIGNADPRALTIALDAWDVQLRLGSPEGELAIAQAIVYLAVAAKSNAVYLAWKSALADAAAHGSLEVPVHLRNAPTRLMKELGYGHDYRYAHDEPEGYAAGESYLPDELTGRRYYQPVNRGLENRIGERLDYLAALDRTATGTGGERR